MGFAPIKWTCTAFFRPRQLTDRAILANRQTQEKKCPITVRADQCLALPLPSHASDPGTATTLLHVQGTAYGSMSGAAPFSVFVLQVNHTFHQENWSIFTFNGGCQDIIRPGA